MNNIELKVDAAGWHLCGSLDFMNVMKVYQDGVKRMMQSDCPQQINIDFSGLVATNSVLIALMIDWKRHAEKCGKRLQFENLSQDIQALIHAAGLEAVTKSLVVE